MSGGDMIGVPGGSYISDSYGGAPAFESMSLASPASLSKSGTDYDGDSSIEPRKITKAGTIRTDVKQGSFESAASTTKQSIANSNALLLSENVRKKDREGYKYSEGYYDIKVPAKSYESLWHELKSIGEVIVANQNSQDITERHSDITIELETEKLRLERYEKLYSETKDVEYKIELNDRIFDQERRIKYIEDALSRVDDQVDYSTIYFTLSEEEADYADIVWVEASYLLESLVDSINSVVIFIVNILP
jgi:hypothetical protein